MNGQKQAPSAILLVSCPDQSGILATITGFVSQHGGNILELDKHVEKIDNTFLMRVEWELAPFALPRDRIASCFRPVAERFSMQWSLYFSDVTPRMAIFATKQAHCLHDLLARLNSNDWNVAAPLIISNHNKLAPVAKKFGVEYHHIPITKDTKLEQEQKQLALLKEHEIDFIILARYMQILSTQFIDHYPNGIINIHHSFLPAFPGARPYDAAYRRGVKMIGATSHYATEKLDAGPIIEQDIVQVSHKDDLEDLRRKGQDLEKIVLARAVWNHLQHRTLVYDNRTAVFN